MILKGALITLSKKPYNIDSKSHIGGQAVIEGVMMRGSENIATAIRKSNGEIILQKTDYKSITKRNKFFGLPIIRGTIAFFESMVIGMKTLMFSSEHYDLTVEEEDYKPSKFEVFLDKLLGDNFQTVLIYFSLFISLIFATGLFVIVPNAIAKWAYKSDVFMYNLVESIVKIVILFAYVALISRMKDIQRVFQYHGAEHKTIHCYENKEDLTVENVKKYSVMHPRCGTSFLLIVVMVSIIVFFFFWSKSLWLTIAMRMALLPLVAGLSYEFIKAVGASGGRVCSLLNKPGMWLQRFTTREPDDSQIEVAIKALEAVIVK
jgi:uncharacterized protein YqhQ